MSFRVLIIGPRTFADYARLRDTLDKLLANRLPNVKLLTGGGPGVPMLAASYATARGLEVLPLTPDFERHPRDAVERRDAELVLLADAAVVVPDLDPVVWRLHQWVIEKGIPVHVMGDVKEAKTKVTREKVEEPTRRGLPD